MIRKRYDVTILGYDVTMLRRYVFQNAVQNEFPCIQRFWIDNVIWVTDYDLPTDFEVI